MTIELLTGPPSPQQAKDLERFEQEFSYPLGQDGRFRISHAGDPWRFFQAMGDAAYVLARRDDRILGVLGASLCQIASSQGRTESVLYLGDLKVTPAARGGPLLLALMRRIMAWTAERTASAFAVVMDGTAVTPNRYTGRRGIPAFGIHGALGLLLVKTGGLEAQGDACTRVGSDEGARCLARLAHGRYRAVAVESPPRSLMQPQWLIVGEGMSCGRLEDTFRAKRLYADDGRELRSAHLSYAAFRDGASALMLVRSACAMAAEAGYPLLFVAMAPAAAAQLQGQLGGRVLSVTTATMYSYGLDVSVPWHINTVDI